jgi:zinc/manganese transport system permease protein
MLDALVHGWFFWPAAALVAGVLALAPLGAQVLARGVVFIDLAVAQAAALGVMIANALFDHPGPLPSQAAATAGALLCAALVAGIARRWPAQREALIGLVYVAGAAGALLAARADAHGREHLDALLAADLLWAEPAQAAVLAACALLVLALAGLRPDALRRDALFFPLFAVVASLAVPALGLFLVFAGLIAPGLWLRRGLPLPAALAIALGAGFAGLALSWFADLPSGPAVALTMAAAGLAAVVWAGRAVSATRQTPAAGPPAG